MQSTIIERPAAGGNRGPAKYIDLGQDYLAEQLFKRKTDSPSKDKWPIILRTRRKNIERLAEDRARRGTLDKEAMEVIRSEWTWTQIALGQQPDTVMLRLIHRWPISSHSELARMTEPERQHARELQSASFRSLIEWAEFRPTWTPTLALGNLLKVTPEERKRLDLRLIRYAGQTDDIMKREQRQRNREGKARDRRADGIPIREEWRAASKAQTRPWEEEGISRSGWYKRRAKSNKEAEAASGQVVPQQEKNTSLISEQPVHRVEEGGARDRAPHPPGRPTIRDRLCVSPHRARLLRDLKLMVADLWAGRPPQPPPAPVPERLQ